MLGLLALVFPWTWGLFFTDGDMWDGVKGNEISELWVKKREEAEPGHADKIPNGFESHQVRTEAAPDRELAVRSVEPPEWASPFVLGLGEVKLISPYLTSLHELCPLPLPTPRRRIARSMPRMWRTL